MPEQDDKFLNTFFEEAYEHLASFENTMLEIELAADNPELVGCAFRALHTIKGSGAMFGLDDLSRFTHEVEAVFDLVRSGKLALSRPLADLALKAGDHIRCLLDAARAGGEADCNAGEALVAALKKVSTSSGGRQSADADSATYRIRFAPAPDIFLKGVNPLLLIAELRELGRCDVYVHTDNIPTLNMLDPESCNLFWDIIVTTTRGVDAIKDVFLFLDDDSEVRVDMIDDGASSETSPDYKKLGEILSERGDVDSATLEEFIRSRKRIGEELVAAGVTASGNVESALLEQRHVREARASRATEQASRATEQAASIRVPLARLDQLVNLVGELVIVQARISRAAQEIDASPLFALMAEELERLTAELRDNSLGIRMVPIGGTFDRFRRLVRDLSGELGKDIAMTTEGGETELDKTVIERLNDPLVHIIRNSLDHGIETPEARDAAGKPKTGTVHLSASHSGPNVIIEISDDGAGLNADAIRAKAVERGLIAADSRHSDAEIFPLVFQAGFSTAKRITDVSGRGVGMDVVKRAIESLGGTARIDSRRGEGTTITITLPLTLAIIDGLLVEAGGESFVLPMQAVRECIELTRDDAARSHGRKYVNVRGSILPYMRLREWFGMGGEVPGIEQIIVTESGGHRTGIAVDCVVGGCQTVIKKLGSLYQNVEGVSGATIMGNGGVALILDVRQLAAAVELHENEAVAGL